MRRMSPYGNRRSARGGVVLTPAFDRASLFDHYWISSAGLTLNGSSQVTQWDDQVGSLNFVAAAGREVPTTASDANFNGATSLNFGGSHSLWTSATDLDLSSTNNYTTWLVLKHNTAATQIIIEQSSNVAVLNGYYLAVVAEYRVESNSTSTGRTRADATEIVDIVNPVTIAASVDNNGTLPGVSVVENGSTSFTMTADGASTAQTGNGGSEELYLGSRTNASLFANLDLVELGISKVKLTAEQIQQLHDSAAAAYGL